MKMRFTKLIPTLYCGLYVPSNLRFDVQCEWVDLRYDPSFHVSSPPTLATVLPPECQRVFASEGRS